MLLELSISNFAIIDRLQLPLGPHLNVFTGETGAGKSILMDAIAALVGERAPGDLVRAGSERAVVEGVFDVAAVLARAAPQASAPGARPEESSPAGFVPEGETFGEALAELGIEPEEGTLILARDIARAGRGTARVNGRAVPLSALQRIAGYLIDIHGQSAHLALLRPEEHIYYLDRYAGTEELRAQVSGLVGQWRATTREYERLQRDEREIERQIELLRYQADEIAAARLRPGEIEDLERERRLLTNAERLTELGAEAAGALSGGEIDDTPGALDLLARARRALGELLRLDDSLGEQRAALEQALYLAQDVASGLRAYQETLGADPRRQVEVEERLELLARLRRKYGASVEEILAFAEAANAELGELAQREERAAALEQEAAAIRARIGDLAGRLSLRRRQAGEQLIGAMERELGELNMRRARFRAEILQHADGDGVPIASGVIEGEASAAGRYRFGPTGIDRVEFLIAPNPGEPMKPLARIASGGETSRLMLALKTILSHADAVPILIFDEIDAGISGRAGQVVGEKLWRLGRSHQVLCVTHLPQIAALADTHFRVSKAEQGERTTTQVEELEREGEREEEIGQMLGGTRAARANAADLLRRAVEWRCEAIG